MGLDASGKSCGSFHSQRASAPLRFDGILSFVQNARSINAVSFGRSHDRQYRLGCYPGPTQYPVAQPESMSVIVHCPYGDA